MAIKAPWYKYVVVPLYIHITWSSLGLTEYKVHLNICIMHLKGNVLVRLVNEQSAHFLVSLLQSGRFS